MKYFGLKLENCLIFAHTKLIENFALYDFIFIFKLNN